MTLYEIDNAVNSVIENGFKVDEETGEVLFTADDIEQLQLDRQAKIENIALYIKNTVSFANDIDTEIKTLTERKKAAERKAESLKSYLAFILNGEKFKTAKCAISYRKSERVEVANVETLPDEYIRFELKKTANKDSIKRALKEGVKIEGCTIDERINMTIK